MQVNIEALCAYLEKQYGGKVRAESLFMKLVEEIGEVAEALNKIGGRKAADGEDLENALGSELADVIHYAVAIAAVSGLDLNQIILEKDARASAKYNRQQNLAQFIRELQG